TRIERILKRKNELQSLYTLIDDRNDSKAIKVIDPALNKKNNIYSHIQLRLKGDAMLRLNRSEEAKDFFT
ncbi:hypothetical protein V6250_21320, partial [Pseudoalteromonas undina]